MRSDKLDLGESSVVAREVVMVLKVAARGWVEYNSVWVSVMLRLELLYWYGYGSLYGYAKVISECTSLIFI